jgi:signal transduction histidine kinase
MLPRRSDFGLIVCLAAVYVVAARFGLAFDAVAGFATLVWPPTGISIAALLLLGYRFWPGVFIGAALANVITGAALPVALGIGVGNTLEALAGALLLRRIPGFMLTLENVQSSVAIMLAALSSALLSATIGAASLHLGGIIGSSQLRITWRAWWIGDIVGAIVVAPMILVWARAPGTRIRHQWIEAAGLALALIIICKLAFFGDHVALFSTPFHQTNLLFAALIWAAFRFGQRGSATAAFFVSVAAVTATVLGHGPFVQNPLRNGLLSLQTFLATTDATLLLFASALAERRAALTEANRAHEDAARANTAKSQFLAVMSHELRTPLNGIAGYAELLRDGIFGALNDKQLDAVTRIRGSEQRLLSLVDELLGFASLEKGDVVVQREEVRVVEAFDAVEPLIESEVRHKHFVLKRELPPSALTVRADRRGLQQILVNLLSNASKYTGDGGTITLGADRDGSRVRVWVRDTGVGIAPGELQRVFEPFFQAERGTTRRYEGVGLGLTIARELARRMDGEVTIASRVGSGTTASVLLPAA